eukprot:COSAG03_NODE_754_length_5988_cov_2.801155_1_plen_273_part_00
MIAPDGTVLTRASETFSWMFADAGLALQGGTTEEDDPDLMKGKLTAGLNTLARINPYRWKHGTAQAIFHTLSTTSDGPDAARPIRLKELGQRKWVNQDSVQEFESASAAATWINANYLDPGSIARLTLNRPDQHVSTHGAADDGYGGIDAIRKAGCAKNDDLVQKIQAILEGKSMASSVENHGTIPQLRFGDRRWEYQDLDGCWVPYGADVCKALNAAVAGSTVSVANTALIEADRGAGDESIELLAPAHAHGMHMSTRALDEAAAMNRWIW